MGEGGFKAEIALRVSNDDLAALLANDMLGALKAQRDALVEEEKRLAAAVEAADRRICEVLAWAPTALGYRDTLRMAARSALSVRVSMYAEGAWRGVDSASVVPEALGVEVVEVQPYVSGVDYTMGPTYNGAQASLTACGVTFSRFRVSLTGVPDLLKDVVNERAVARADVWRFQAEHVAPLDKKINDIPALQAQVRAELVRRSLGTTGASPIEQATEDIRARLRARLGLEVSGG